MAKAVDNKYYINFVCPICKAINKMQSTQTLLNTHFDCIECQRPLQVKFVNDAMLAVSIVGGVIRCQIEQH